MGKAMHVLHQHGKVDGLPHGRCLLRLLAVSILAVSWNPARAENLQFGALAPPMQPVPLSQSAAEYSAAMYMIKERTRTGLGILASSGFVPASGIPFFWHAANGSSLLRVEEGVFKMTVGDCVSQICTDLTCYAQDWPIFVCDDDEARTMSAPNPTTVVFDGTVFTRAGDGVAGSTLGDPIPN